MVPCLPVGPSLAKRGLKTSESVLWHQKTFFRGKRFPPKNRTFACYYTHRNLSNDIRTP